MCGICGFITKKNISKDMLIKMNNLLAHRGPDDHGEEIYQICSDRYVGFAHRRLSIMDLSDKGHQPMHSANRQISIVFNGEIYNYQDLRQELSDYPFISDCDTEVILAAYLKWGIDFVDKINGMYAIALLDRESGKVYLIRDRIGKKPLYYYRDNDNNIIFASELKAIFASSLFYKEINKDIIGSFLYRGYIAAPDTVYRNVYKLEPGTILEIAEKQIKKYKYWDIALKYQQLRGELITNYEEAKEKLRELIKRSVSRRLIADVPIGAFLSGGYDSSLVCAIAQEISVQPLKTFSIGFHEDAFNEAPYARKISEVLGTEHTEYYAAEKEMLEMLDSIPYYYDEPFADSSQFPTMLVSKLAKEKVSVVLSGDGGDELFGGYNIYSILQMVQKKQIQGKLLYALGKIPRVRETKFWKKRSIVERILSDDNNVEARTQAGVNSYFDVINNILLHESRNFYFEFESRYNEARYDITRMLLDMDTSLPDDMLTKVDRASMRYALECRCPILDKEILEFSFRLPAGFKNNSGISKKILKDITYEYIPKEIMDRPKSGFVIPLDKWLHNELKERIYDWTNRHFLRKQGIFDVEETVKFIDGYMKTGDAGKWSGQNFSRIVWAYFVFQKWFQIYESKN